MKYIITEKQLANLNKKKTIAESVLKIGKLMYYDPKKTATENKKNIIEQWQPSMYANWVARRAARKVMNPPKPKRGRTYQNNTSPATPKVYTDHDKVWDYKIENNMWFAKKKAGGNWISLQNYPAAIEKLNKFYGTTIPA